MLKNRYLSILAVAAVLGAAACGDKNKTEGSETQTSDTTAIAGQDTVNTPTVVPTTDSVVQTTTTQTDTIQGQAQAPAATTTTGTTTTTTTDTTKKP